MKFSVQEGHQRKMCIFKCTIPLIYTTAKESVTSQYVILSSSSATMKIKAKENSTDGHN